MAAITNQASRLLKMGNHSCSRANGCDITATRPQTNSIPIRLELELCSHRCQLGILDTGTGILSVYCALGLKYTTPGRVPRESNSDLVKI